MSGTTIDGSGDVSDQATAPTLEVVQLPSTHVGTPTDNFTLPVNGAVVSFYNGQPFIADASLYAAINGSPAAAALVTWSD